MARVLIVDDEELLRAALREVLEKHGHEVFEAGNGIVGTQLLDRSPVDLVITDLIMPAKEGIETIRDIKRAHPGIRVIALSGRGGIALNANLERAMRVGADRALQKPCEAADVLKVVDELLETAPTE